MWLQLIALALVAEPAPSPSPAEVRLRLDGYDDGWITVLSPALAARLRLADEVDVAGHVTVDAISGATRSLTTTASHPGVDAVSSATRFAETRYEGELGTTWSPDALHRVRAGYLLSSEPDYVSHALALGGEIELLDRRATASLGYRLSLERVGSVDDPTVDEALAQHALDLGWTHVVAKRTALTVLVAASHAACGARLGCGGSPYRHVGMTTAGSGTIDLAIAERHPDERTRAAVALRLVQVLHAQLGLHAGYRLYADSWEVLGHTADLALVHTLLAERLTLRLQGRVGAQSAASFVRASYVFDASAFEVPAWRTADRELGEIVSGEVEATAAWDIARLGGLGALSLELTLAWHHWRYARSPGPRTREAWRLGGGLGATF
ncbi:MAG: DUF3570 domain-containing protein [Deltaproteobacteria bacterium]|nr:DUF3570 domain-containing protein [Deltaproteobacteria bacterium]